jgi:uncharacterized membrane protein HdeD (DUF308 family)
MALTDDLTGRARRATPARPGIGEALREATGHWWLSLAAGVAWVVISLVILQFDAASVTTVGVLAGLMFVLAAVQNLALTAIPGVTRWVSALFGGLFVVSAAICFADPAGTFAALADILGFLFGLVGLWWMVRAFLEQPVYPLWWTGLVSGILMTVLAFWTEGQFFLHKAYLLLVLAGVWALMQGVGDITRAFAVRRLHDELWTR